MLNRLTAFKSIGDTCSPVRETIAMLLKSRIPILCGPITFGIFQAKLPMLKDQMKPLDGLRKGSQADNLPVFVKCVVSCSRTQRIWQYRRIWTD